MSMPTEAIILIENLSKIQHAPKARKEALRLSKALTAVLEEPENAAVELAFSVH